MMSEQTERPAIHYMPPPAPECGTCLHEGQSLEDWPCCASLSAAGLLCWEPKQPKGAAHGC